MTYAACSSLSTCGEPQRYRSRTSLEDTNMHLRKHAFTLIELLVVIAIIAIIAAFLCPVFAQAPEDGRKATCLSNVKQMGLAVAMYAADFDDAFVPWIQNTGKKRDRVRSDRL